MRKKNLILVLFLLIWIGQIIAQTNIRFTDASRLTYVKKKAEANGNGSVVGIQDKRVKFHKIQYRNRLEYHQFDTYDDPDDPHGTHVVLKAFDNGNLSPSSEQAADGATLFSKFIHNEIITNMSNFPNIYVANRSYGGDITGSYNPDVQAFDNAMLSYDNFIYVFSSGNEKGKSSNRTNYGLYTNGNANFVGIVGNKQWARLSGNRKQCKNGITVGALSHIDKPSTISSPGPTFDGRLKPDIVANGGKSNAATSFTAPQVAASIAVLQEIFKQDNPQELAAPAAYIKALILNTADDMGRPGPDFTTGFGRLNSRRAYEAMDTNKMATYRLDQDSTVNVDFDDSGLNRITIPTPLQGNKWTRLKIMLYWHDVDNASSNNKALVNDIDMTATHFKSNGAIIKDYMPLVLDHRFLDEPDGNKLLKEAEEGEDHRNNIEQIVIENPIPGSYVEVDLTAFNIPNGFQKCYVVYDLVPEELVLVYPVEGETDTFVQGQSEYIRWDANGFNGGIGTNDQFKIEMLIDGEYETIDIVQNQDYEGNPTNYSHDIDRHYLLDIDAIEDQYQEFENFDITRIRISAYDQFDNPIQDAVSESGDIVICRTVKNLTMTALCTDGANNYAEFTWNPIEGANDYRVYRLGLEDKEMQHYQYTNGATSIILDNLDMDGLNIDGKGEWREWVAIAPVFRENGNANIIEGRRCKAFEIEGDDFGCITEIIPLGGLDTRVWKTTLHAYISPVTGQSISNIQFQYNLGSGWINVGALNTQVYITKEYVSQELNFPLSDKINTGDKYHFRLEYEIDASGSTITTDEIPIQLPAGTALYLEGNASVKMPYINEYVGNTERTIDFWANINDFNNSSLISIGNESNNNGPNDILVFKTTSINNEFEFQVNDGQNHIFTVPNLSNDWHHYAIVYKNNTLALSIDGSIVYQTNGVSLNTGEYDIEIGRDGFIGQMDEIRFWNVGKSINDIRKIIHVPSLEREFKFSVADGATNELVRYIQFNEEGNKPLESIYLRKLKTSASIIYEPSPLPMGGPKFGTIETLIEGSNDFANQSTSMTLESPIPPSTDTNDLINAEIAVTRIDAKPHNAQISSVGSLGYVKKIYDKSYRVVYNHSNKNDAYNFKIAVQDLLTTDNPSHIVLLRRSTNGSGNWIYVTVANQISSNSLHTFAHFQDVKDFGQFIVVQLDRPVPSTRLMNEDDFAQDDLDIKVYPNPLSISTILNIEINETDKDLRLNIFDNLGKIVKSELLPSSHNSISTDQLPVGNYTCQIVGEDTLQLYQIVIIK